MPPSTRYMMSPHPRNFFTGNTPPPQQDRNFSCSTPSQGGTFGPVVCVIACKTDVEAIDLANVTYFSLAAAVFSKDIMRAVEVTRQVRSGSCHIIGPTVYIEAPFPNDGTAGSSGYGRFGGVVGIEAFTEKKIVTLADKGMK